MSNMMERRVQCSLPEGALEVHLLMHLNGTEGNTVANSEET